MGYIWIHKNWYKKIYGNLLGKLLQSYRPFGTMRITSFFVTTRVIWLCVAKKLFHNTILYNKNANLNSLEDIARSKVMNASRFYKVKHWDPPPFRWLKWNNDASNLEQDMQQQLVTGRV